jgi:hypothetical protein
MKDGALVSSARASLCEIEGLSSNLVCHSESGSSRREVGARGREGR